MEPLKSITMPNHDKSRTKSYFTLGRALPAAAAVGTIVTTIIEVPLLRRYNDAHYIIMLRTRVVFSTARYNRTKSILRFEMSPDTNRLSVR